MSYQYDHDCPFEAFITNLGKYNEGKLVGEWVKFPTTTEEMEKVFERIGIGSKDAYRAFHRSDLCKQCDSLTDREAYDEFKT